MGVVVEMGRNCHEERKGCIPMDRTSPYLYPLKVAVLLGVVGEKMHGGR